jgi:hypothetical protein
MAGPDAATTRWLLRPNSHQRNRSFAQCPWVPRTNKFSHDWCVAGMSYLHIFLQTISFNGLASSIGRIAEQHATETWQLWLPRWCCNAAEGMEAHKETTPELARR